MLRLKNNRFLESILILLGITFLFVSILVLPGCEKEGREETTPKNTVETPSPQEQITSSTFKEIFSPVSFPYIVDNNLEDKEQDNVQDGLYSIKGLQNKEIENDINLEIEKRYQQLKNSSIPPYRGIMKSLDEESLIEAEEIHTFEYFSGYNLLSLQISASRTYPVKNSPENPLYTTFIDCYTVDLNTGIELHLKDLFTNDTDYKKIINNFIINEVNRVSNIEWDEFGEQELTLVYPFTGIKDDQKFLLTPYEILIVIDDKTPEFDTKYTYNTISIPYRDLEGHIAIKQRFYDDYPSIFENPETSKQLISYYPLAVKGETDVTQIDNLTFYYTARYPENIPLLWENIFLDYTQSKDNNVLIIAKNHPGETYYTLEYQGWVVGPYFIIQETSMTNTDQITEFTSIDTVYDDQGEIVKFQNLIKSGFDYKIILDDHIKAMIQMEGNNRLLDFKAVKSSLNYSISPSSFTFTTKPFNFGQGQVYPLSFYIPFTEFGCENLVFFDENP